MCSSWSLLSCLSPGAASALCSAALCCSALGRAVLSFVVLPYTEWVCCTILDCAVLYYVVLRSLFVIIYFIIIWLIINVFLVLLWIVCFVFFVVISYVVSLSLFYWVDVLCVVLYCVAHYQNHQPNMGGGEDWSVRGFKSHCKTLAIFNQPSGGRLPARCSHLRSTRTAATSGKEHTYHGSHLK